MNEPGFYNWLIRAMIEALDVEIQEIKEAIEFWSTRPPIGDKEFDERSKKDDRALVDLNLDELRKVESARGLLAPLESKMPRHHVVRAYLAILKGLEYEIKDYRTRMARLIPEYEKRLDEWATDLRLTLLAASELEQAVGKAKECATSLVSICELRRSGKQTDPEEAT